MVDGINAAAKTSDTANIKPYVNTNYAKYLPKDAVATGRLLTLFDINGNKEIDDDEPEGLTKVLESDGYEMWNIYNKEGRRIAYVWDSTEKGITPQWYEYVQLNENNQIDYYTRVNIYTGDETFIRYQYDENGNETNERYHNMVLDGSVQVEYTGPDNKLTKKRTERTALYKQTEEFLKDFNGDIIFDEETGEPKRKEELIGYQTIITEYEYDKDFNLVGVPKETRKTELIQNKPKKSLNIKG